MLLSIIIPVLNDADQLDKLLQQLSRDKTKDFEIIVVDGGSMDATRQVALNYTDKVLRTGSGRAKQMNIGAAQASGDIFWFLHADTVLPDNPTKAWLPSSEQMTGWGFFKIRLSGNQALFRVIETMMNQRSFSTGIATGDQGIFIDKALFKSVGGFPEIAIMEDIAISKLLKNKQRPLAIKHHCLITSSRRWEEQGILRTIFLMWRLRLAYFLGADPNHLVKLYYS